jgi:hypothetical protein
MAQSIEGKLLVQVRDSLARVDFNVATFAAGTSAYPPLIKIRMAELVSAIGKINRIDRSYGQFTPTDHEAVKYLASLREYVVGLDTTEDYW